MCILETFSSFFQRKKQLVIDNQYYTPSDLFVPRYSCLLFYKDIYYVSKKMSLTDDVDKVKILCSLYLSKHVPCSKALKHLDLRRSKALKIFVIIHLRLKIKSFRINSLVDDRCLTWKRNNEPEILKLLKEFEELPKPILENEFLKMLNQVVEVKKHSENRKRTLTINPTFFEENEKLYVYKIRFSIVSFYKEVRGIKIIDEFKKVMKELRDKVSKVKDLPQILEERLEASRTSNQKIIEVAQVFLENLRIKRLKKRKKELSPYASSNSENEIAVERSPPRKRRAKNTYKELALMYSEDFNAKDIDEIDEDAIFRREEINFYIKNNCEPHIITELLEEEEIAKISPIHFNVCKMIRMKKIKHFRENNFFVDNKTLVLHPSEVDNIYVSANFNINYDYDLWFPEVFGINDLNNTTGFICRSNHFFKRVQNGDHLDVKKLYNQRKINFRNYHLISTFQKAIRGFFSSEGLDIPSEGEYITAIEHNRKLAKKRGWDLETEIMEYRNRNQAIQKISNHFLNEDMRVKYVNFFEKFEEPFREEFMHYRVGNDSITPPPESFTSKYCKPKRVIQIDKGILKEIARMSAERTNKIKTFLNGKPSLNFDRVQKKRKDRPKYVKNFRVTAPYPDFFTKLAPQASKDYQYKSLPINASYYLRYLIMQSLENELSADEKEAIKNYYRVITNEYDKLKFYDD